LVLSAECLASAAGFTAGLQALGPGLVACDSGACAQSYWQPSPWSACSASCGGGAAVSDGLCIASGKRSADALDCGAPSFTEQRPCNTSPCRPAIWVVSMPHLHAHAADDHRGSAFSVLLCKELVRELCLLHGIKNMIASVSRLVGWKSILR
jgi:Thrombospondin type 1 domain